MPTSGSSSGHRLVLDTSAYSHLRGGDARILDRVAAATLILLPAIVLGELEAGFALGARSAENRRSLAELLAEPFVQAVPIDATVARQYGRLFAHLRRAGTPVPTNDIWIAAVAIDRAATLLTFDDHFRHLRGLDCEIMRTTGSRR
jgi:tRNA(fMet)-specific endonuclease VapC